MGRPLTGKKHIGERRETRKNGDVYVYERVTEYDPKTRKTKTISSRLLGKIPAGSTEMIPTRPKTKTSEVEKALLQDDSSHAGLQTLLDWIGCESGIDEDLQTCFSKDDAQKLSSIARYWLATDGGILPRLATWQIMNPLPYPYVLSEDVYEDLFRSVGSNESSVQLYFHCRADRVPDKDAMFALETTCSMSSQNQIEAWQGFNQDGDELDTIKLLVMYSLGMREPIAFRKQPDNFPDRIALENALQQLEVLKLPTPVIVTDNGFYSQTNMTHCVCEHMKFLMLANNTDKWVREEIDACRAELENFDNICPFDVNVSGLMRSRQYEFNTMRQHTRAKYAADATQHFLSRLYVHVFSKPQIAPLQERRLRESLFSLKQDLESGVEEFCPSAQKMIDTYLEITRDTRGVKVAFKMEQIKEARRYWGYFVLLSNEIGDPFEALRAYRDREKIEELFARYQDSFDRRKPRRWWREDLYGRQFAQFIALGYHCFLAKRILEVKNELRKRNEEEKTCAQVNLEKKLLSWLEETSQIQILDWFRCVDFVAATATDAASKWTSETTQRDRLFLNMLGVT